MKSFSPTFLSQPTDPPTPRWRLSLFPVSQKRYSMCVKAKYILLFFSLLYTTLVLHLAVLNKSSNCSWCPACILVAFVILCKLYLASYCQQPRALCGLSATCAQEQSSSYDWWKAMDHTAVPSPLERKSRCTLCHVSQMSPSRTEPRRCPLSWSAFTSLPHLPIPHGSFLISA